MLISGYGILLRRLTIDDIEIVRQHRNSKVIQQYMEFQQKISVKDQLKWFNSINNINNNYFIIEHNNIKVGLIYGADINWKDRTTGNGGIFIWNLNYWETATPTSSSFLLTDTSILLGLKKTYIKVLKSNSRASEFNKSLGYKLLPNQENLINQKYCLDIADYKTLRTVLRKKLFNEKDYNNLSITFDKTNEVDNFYLDLIQRQHAKNNTDFEIKFTR